MIVVEHDEEAIRAADHVRRHGARRRRSRRPRRRAGHARGRRSPTRNRSPAAISRGSAADRGAARGATGRARTGSLIARRARQQPEGRRRSSCRSACSSASPASPARASRRSSTTRSTPRSRAHLYGSARRAGAARRDRGPRAARQGDQRRPEPDRPHAALQPGDLHRPVHADPRAVRRRAGSARARLRRRALLVQREGRALRGVPGRRRHQGRDALPARHLRAVRRLPRQALQPRDARDPLQGQEHPRSARDDRGGGAREFFAAGAGDRAQAADADRRRPGLRAPRPVARPRSPAAKRSA